MADSPTNRHPPDFNQNERYALEKRAIAKSFSAAAASYDANAFLQQEVGKRLLERLDYMKLTPERILDIGSGTGACTRALQKRFPKARVFGLDLAFGMAREAQRRRGWFAKEQYLCADAERLPFATGSVDLVVSNLAFQWLAEPEIAFSEIQRVLKPNGLLLFSSFGPDTLKELRAAWATVDDRIHVNRFMDMHDVGDAMVRARLADPVMDMEALVLTYKEVPALLRELKGIGAHNINAGRSHALTTPAQLKQMMTAYENFRRADGSVPATWEVVYGHAWGTEVRARPTGLANEFAMPISDIPIRRKQP